MPELLLEKRMSQAEFARKLKVSESFVTQIINLSAKFSIIKAKEAADLFKVYIDDLYEWEYD